MFDLMDLWGVVLKELTMDSISNCTKSEDDDFFFFWPHGDDFVTESSDVG